MSPFIVKIGGKKYVLTSVSILRRGVKETRYRFASTKNSVSLQRCDACETLRSRHDLSQEVEIQIARSIVAAQQLPLHSAVEAVARLKQYMLGRDDQFFVRHYANLRKYFLHL